GGRWRGGVLGGGRGGRGGAGGGRRPPDGPRRSRHRCRHARGDRGEHPRRDHPASAEPHRGARSAAGDAGGGRSSPLRAGPRPRLRHVGADRGGTLPVGVGRRDGVLLLPPLQRDVRQRSTPLRHGSRSMRPFVTGLVLAAGASTRLGRPKQLLPFGDTTMLGRVVGEVCAATALDQVVVVLGGAAAEVRRQVGFGTATVVENEAFTEGCASSYRTGLNAANERAAAVMVLLGDQPGVDRAVIDLAVEEWRRAASPIMLVSYRGRLGHPLIF